jgi:hypothetical protein
MKLIKFISIPIILVVMVFIWQGCRDSKLHFSGRVVDKRGNGLTGVQIKVGEAEERTKEGGKFEIYVARSERYVLNASLLNFGHVSKIYTDTSSHVLITMAKATVVRGRPNQEIVVQDMHPDMTSIAPRITSPLDTIPFVYNEKGELIGFTRPPSLRNAQKAIADYQPPVLGARIEIPAGSLVFEGSERQPDGEMDISLNTVDIYSSDGMPGDYTVDLGKGKEVGYMIPFGAANIEAYYNGQSLQLGPNRKAKLIIPVDTLAIIAKDMLPAEIPLLLYDRITGLWKIDGAAQLNTDKTAYSTEITHFSTYNMDLFKTDPSCIQICKELQAGSTLTITATDGTKIVTRTMPTDTDVCASGRCIVFGSTGIETSGVINMPNNTNAEFTVTNGGTVATYIINSGSRPPGSPSVYQQCDFDACAGPFYITDNKCWEIKDAAPPHNVTGMNAPVMTFTLGATDFTWIFVESTSGGTITNSNNYYEIEFQTFSGSFTGALGAWNKVTFGGGSSEHFPIGGTASSEWKFSTPGDNPGINPTDVMLFRVNVFINPGEEPGSSTTVHPTIKGVIAIRNFNSLSVGDKSNLLTEVNAEEGPDCPIIIN